MVQLQKLVSLAGLALIPYAAAVPCQERDVAATYEAEDAILTGTVVDTAQAGFTGMLALSPPLLLRVCTKPFSVCMTI